jgi:vesicle-fusing ATPase
MRQLDFQQLFNRELAVLNINTHNELTAVLREVRAFDNDSDLAESLNELRDITSTDRIGIGIKKVLLAIAEAKQDKGNVIGRFAEVIALQMAASVD